MNKQQFYLSLCDQLAPLWNQDATLLDTDPTSWHLARQIDDWLCQYKDNPRVSQDQYERNCQRLVGLYVAQPETAQIKEAQ